MNKVNELMFVKSETIINIFEEENENKCYVVNWS